MVDGLKEMVSVGSDPSLKPPPQVPSRISVLPERQSCLLGSFLPGGTESLDLDLEQVWTGFLPVPVGVQVSSHNQAAQMKASHPSHVTTAQRLCKSGPDNGTFQNHLQKGSSSLSFASTHTAARLISSLLTHFFIPLKTIKS